MSVPVIMAMNCVGAYDALRELLSSSSNAGLDDVVLVEF